MPADVTWEYNEPFCETQTDPDHTLPDEHTHVPEELHSVLVPLHVRVGFVQGSPYVAERSYISETMVLMLSIQMVMLRNDERP